MVAVKDLFLAFNELLLRRSMLTSSINPAKDIEKECGHPALSEEIKVEAFSQMWSRDGIAKRIVRLFPEECWKMPPDVYETEGEKTETAFEKSWGELPRLLRSDGVSEGFFKPQNNQGNAVFET